MMRETLLRISQDPLLESYTFTQKERETSSQTSTVESNVFESCARGIFVWITALLPEQMGTWKCVTRSRSPRNIQDLTSPDIWNKRKASQVHKILAVLCLKRTMRFDVSLTMILQVNN